MKNVSLADKISSILTTTPGNIDSDNDFEDGTQANLHQELKDSDTEISYQSRFRKNNIDLLADIDERYAGEKGSRKNISSDEDFEILSESNYLKYDKDSESDGSNQEMNSDESNKETDPSDASSDENDSGDSNQEYGDTFDSQSSTNFKHLENTDMSHQRQKGICVKNQMNIWENLLEMRIQMQKCLIAANKMPQHEIYKEFKKDCGQDFTDNVLKTKQSLLLLLDKLLLFQNLAWKNYPELKKFQAKKSDNDTDDEEIPSDTDEEECNEDAEEIEESPKKRVKLSDFDKDLQNKHDLYKEYRNNIIQKWHEKTRMSLMKNSTNNVQSIINHIEHTLTDKEKLVKRTRLKRNDYKIIGEVDENSDIEDSDLNKDKPVEIYNNEIFDDDDFYHRLLRELIEFKSSDLTDPVQLGRQWIQLQNLRSKMKRKIDTKATKGRKIRYAVHTKLVNFMAPIHDNLWTQEAKTELFGSLFGKNQAV